MFNLTIETLLHGWCDLHIDLNQESTICCFENVPNDALADILLSAIRTINTSLDSFIDFPNGSEKSTMYLKDVDKSTCNIAFKNDSLNMGKGQYARAVLRMFDKYLYEQSMENYKAEWGAFPSQELEKLRAAYHRII